MDDRTRRTGDMPWHDEAPPADDPVGLIYTWWRGDPLPALRPVSDLRVERVEDADLISAITGIDVATVRERIQQRQWPWLARIAGQPAGWGWVATCQASIGELGITLALPVGNRYLWDFVTLPAWRGRGVYRQLLQMILRHELEADRFWVGHDTPNVASRRGILRAGFRPVGAVHRRPTGTLIFVPDGPPDRATAGAALLDLPLVAPSTEQMK